MSDHPLSSPSRRSAPSAFARRNAVGLSGAAGALLLSAAIGTPWVEQIDYGNHLPAPDVFENATFWALLLAGAFVIWILQAAQFSRLGTALAFRLSRLQQRLAPWRRGLMINATIFAMTAMAASGDMILAPELATHRHAVRWLQVIAALALFSRRGRPFAGVVLALLFVIGIHDYGPLPMLGHLVFVGVALYLMLASWPHSERVLVLRAATAAALMWLAVEKWIEPDWALRVAREHPVVTLGFAGPEAALLAGVVQCSLGFGLLWRGLYATVSAVALAIFISVAIVESNFVDFAGQVTMLGVLLFLALDRVPTRMYGQRQGAAHVAVSFVLSAVGAVLVHLALLYAHSA
jgi:hypothetical protein